MITLFLLLSGIRRNTYYAIFKPKYYVIRGDNVCATRGVDNYMLKSYLLGISYYLPGLGGKATLTRDVSVKNEANITIAIYITTIYIVYGCYSFNLLSLYGILQLSF